MESQRKAHVGSMIILPLICIAYCLPLFSGSSWAGQDFYFHMSRILSLSNVWQSPVNFLVFAHHGNMVSQFYPWLTLYPAYVFVRALGNALLGYRLFIILCVYLAALSAYMCFNSIQHSETRSLLFSIMYTFASYHATNIFLRSALGEILCAIFLPIVFLGLYRILHDDYHRWQTLAIGMSLLVYTHVLSFALTSLIALVLTTLYLPATNHRKQRVFSIIKAAILTVGFSVAFVGPLMDMMLHQNIAWPTAPNLYSSTASSGNLVKGIIANSLGSFGIGLLIAAAALWSIFHYTKLTTGQKILTFLSVVMIFVQLSTPLSQFISSTPLSHIQFIWRLNAFTTLFVAYVFCAEVSLPKLSTLQSVASWVLLTASLLALNMVSYSNLQNGPTNLFIHGKVSTNAKVMRHIDHYAHSDYRPAGSPSPFIKTESNKLKLPPTSSELSYKAKFNAGTAYFAVQNHLQRPITFRTNVYSYYNTRTSVNDHPGSTHTRNGLVSVNLPHGKSKIAITYRYSIWTFAAWTISLLVALIVAFYRRKLPNRLLTNA